MPVDVSIYNRLNPPDPIAGLSSTVGLANAFTTNQILNARNQLTQGEVQGQGQYGQALAGAMNPDGTIDPNKANQAYVAAGGNPIYLPEAANNSAALYGSNIANQRNQALGVTEQATNGAALVNAEAARPGSTRQSIVSTADQALWAGTMSPQAHDFIVNQLPLGDAAAKQKARSLTLGFVSPTQQSAPTSTGFDQNTLAPMTGTFAGASTKAANAGGGNGFAATPPPGVEDAAKTSEAALANHKLVTAPGLLQANRPIENAIDVLGKLNNTGFGPNSEDWSTVLGFLQQKGAIPSGTEITNPNELRQVGNKYLHQIASAAASSGIRTDAGLNQANSSNVSMDLTQAAGLHLLKNQLGINRQDAMQSAAYEIEGRPNGVTWANYGPAYLKSTDPRALALDKQSPEERNATFNSFLPPSSKPLFAPNMTPEQFAAANAAVKKANTPAYQKFVHTYNLAKATNALGASSQSTPQGQ
jgi:hypothetical protein